MSMNSLKNNVKRLSKMTKPTKDGLSIKVVGKNFEASDASKNSCLFNVGIDVNGRGLITSDKNGDEIVDVETVNMRELRKHLIKAGLSIGSGRGTSTTIESLAPKKSKIKKSAK